MPTTFEPTRAHPCEDLPPRAVLASYPGHDGSLWSLLQSRAARGDREFLVYQGRSLTYPEVLSKAARAAAMFARKGMREGDRVAVMARNHPVTVVAWFALSRLGAVMVPVNPNFGVDDARYVFEHAGVCGVVCSPELAEIVEAACIGMQPVPWRLTTEPSERPIEHLESDLRDTPDGESDAAGNADSTCVLIYTSGTTGSPKGVRHSQRTAVLSGEGFVERMHLVPSDRMLCILPMFHLNALFYSLCGAVAAGAVLLLEPQFSASTFWRTAAALRATEVNMIAAMTSILVKRPRTEFHPGHGLCKVYGAPLHEATIRVFQSEFGVPVMIEGYGMSEAPGILSIPWEGPHKAGSMGRPSRHPFAEVKLADAVLLGDDGEVVPAGTTGELAVRTPLLMQGYFGEPPGESSALFRDGWFLTGDLARQDEDGYFWFVARRKDIIRRRGENVSGAEIDAVVSAHPAVQEAAAIPVPSPLGEDDVLVAVVRRPGQALVPEELGAWCKDRLAPWKAPRYVVFLEELPRTPTHRVAKHRLREMRLLDGAVDLQRTD